MKSFLTEWLSVCGIFAILWSAPALATYRYVDAGQTTYRPGDVVATIVICKSQPAMEALAPLSDEAFVLAVNHAVMTKACVAMPMTPQGIQPVFVVLEDFVSGPFVDARKGVYFVWTIKKNSDQPQEPKYYILVNEAFGKHEKMTLN